MSKIAEYKNRLAGLTATSLESSPLSPEQTLLSCRSRQDQLRELKREVLTEIYALRNQTREKTRLSADSEEAKRLLDEVRDQVKGFLDARDDEVETWSHLNREIDTHLDDLAKLETELVRAVGEDDLSLPRIERKSEKDDDIYAAVGAAVRKGQTGGFCSHCGQAVDSDDRFCRQCGHRLQ